MAFHANDGWHFDRLADGSVEITKRFPVPGGKGTLTLHRVVLDPSSWASVVASVSAAGETAESFTAAVRFHSSEV